LHLYLLFRAKYIWSRGTLNGNELILLSETSYSNSQLALRWLQHFVKLTAPHDLGNPKVLLLDSHLSHTSYEFIILAAKHIILYAFPPHLTHVLQRLDVGVFQPYKYWHRQAVLRAIREMDITYNLPLFMRPGAYIQGLMASTAVTTLVAKLHRSPTKKIGNGVHYLQKSS
jgi:hypothetical protein